MGQSIIMLEPLFCSVCLQICNRMYIDKLPPHIFIKNIKKLLFF